MTHKFKKGDRVRLITTYKYLDTFYYQRYPGVGSIGEVIEAPEDDPECTVVKWTDIRSVRTREGFHEVFKPEGDAMSDFSDLVINTDCLQLVVPSDRDVKRALRSIERSLRGEQPLPEPLPPEYAEVYDLLGVRPEEGQ